MIWGEETDAAAAAGKSAAAGVGAAVGAGAPPPALAGSGGGEGGGGGILHVSDVGLVLAAALVGVQLAVSLRLRLGLTGQLLVAGVRCLLQLQLLGVLLKPLFDHQSPLAVVGYASFMTLVSAGEAVGRPGRTYKGMFGEALAVVALCAGCSMAYATLLILRLRPWYDAQYVIPVLGMVLGNTISGVSVALAAVVDELSAGRDRVEKLLALGASRAEATRAPVARAVRLAMAPLLNQMSVVGLVSIPGMMTGQILGGGDPREAARYQALVMYLLGASSSAGAFLSAALAARRVVDGQHRMRVERLLPRGPGGGGVNGALARAAGALWAGAAAAALWCWRRLCCCGGGQSGGGVGGGGGGNKAAPGTSGGGGVGESAGAEEEEEEVAEEAGDERERRRPLLAGSREAGGRR